MISLYDQIWRFQEDNSKFDAVKSIPMPLSQLQQNNFTFSPKESYLCLFIYQSSNAGKLALVNKLFFNCGSIFDRTIARVRAKQFTRITGASAPIVAEHADGGEFEPHSVNK